jgi:hypothetical protein
VPGPVYVCRAASDGKSGDSSIIQNENFKSSISETLEALAELWFCGSTHFISRGPFKPTRKLSAKLFQSMIGKISRLKDVNS